MKARGVALVTGLVMLAAISLLALTAAGGMTLQRHQAANFQDRVRARSAADAAQWAALAWLYSRPDSDRQADCSTACFLPDAIYPADALPEQPEIRGRTWWAAHANQADRHPVSGDPAGLRATVGPDGAWILQEIHFAAITPNANEQAVAGIGYYRLLSRGGGRQVNTVVVTEAIVARPWGGVSEPAAYPPGQPLRVFCSQFDVALPCGILSWRALR